MKKYISNSSYYLDRKEFSTVEASALWRKIGDYIRSNSSIISHATFNAEKGEATFVSYDAAALPSIVRHATLTADPDMSLMRTIKLNLTFDRNLKRAVVSDDIPEGFDGNTVTYSTQCSESASNHSSLFFDQSALQDYASGGSQADWDACKDYLAIVVFSLVVEIDGEQTTMGQMMMVNYNADNDAVFVNDSFAPLNDGVDETIINGYIAHFNDASHRDESFIVAGDGFEARDFKQAVSMFKLPSADATHFIDFKSFVPSTIYEQFIRNLLNKLA